MATSPVRSRIPGALPILGHLPWLRWRPLQFVERQRPLAAVTSFTLRRHPAYLVNDPRLVWRLLTELSSQVGRGRTGDKTRALTGNGLGSSDGDFHLQQRRLIQPVFHRERVTSHVPAFRRAAEQQASRWIDGEPVDLVQQILSVSAVAVLTTLFDVRSPDAPAHEMSTALPTCLDMASRRAFASIKPPRANDSRYAAALGRLHAIADMLGEPDPSGVGGTPSDFLGRLRNAHREGMPGLDDEQIHDEIMTMMVAGVETVATTVCWSLHLLSRNPDITVRVHDELEHVLGGRRPEADDLAELAYLSRVVREALRLFPPVWLVRRRAAVSLQLGGHDIPPGASVYFSPYGLHRDPRWFPQPGRFDPDRWLPETERTLPRGAYLPFGAGVHRCVGEAFGITEVMTILASLIQHWHFVPGSARVRPNAVVTLRPDRMPVTVRRR